MINWPKFEKQPSNESSAVGDAVNQMVARERASAAANQKQLQAARAAEARRQREESLAAAAVLDTTYQRPA
jgi:hypothetical protein